MRFLCNHITACRRNRSPCWLDQWSLNRAPNRCASAPLPANCLSKIAVPEFGCYIPGRSRSSVNRYGLRDNAVRDNTMDSTRAPNRRSWRRVAEGATLPLLVSNLRCGLMTAGPMAFMGRPRSSWLSRPWGNCPGILTEGNSGSRGHRRLRWREIGRTH